MTDEVCGRTKGKQRHIQTWWWNDKVAKVIKEKQRLYKLYEKSKKDEDRIRVEELRRTYQIAKCDAKKAVYKAQEKRGKSLVKCWKTKIRRVAKQIVRSNRDVVGEGCVKDENGKIVVDDKEVLEACRQI